MGSLIEAAGMAMREPRLLGFWLLIGAMIAVGAMAGWRR